MRENPVIVMLEDEEPRAAPTGVVYTLEALLERVTEENRHSEMDWGPSVGNEFLASETVVNFPQGAVRCDYR